MIVGMSNTTITVPTLIADRERFHMYIFEPPENNAEFQQYLAVEDGRQKVLLVKGIMAFFRANSYHERIHSFLVFDSIPNLKLINAHIIDAIETTHTGWKPARFSDAQLNELLSRETVGIVFQPEQEKEEDNMTEDLITLEGAEEGTFRSALYKVLTAGTVPKGFVEQAIKYQCGMLPKRSWSFGVKKPAIKEGADPVALQELEAYCDGRYGVRIHRAIFELFNLAHPEGTTPPSIDDIATKYKADKGDVHFCHSILANLHIVPQDFHYTPAN